MTDQWRQFEKTVARIEQALVPLGAVVKSPDRIPDTVTGELREVDASIRHRVGTSSILITIECRDRTAVEDVRWIEQLAEKKRSIGASVTVAVSSSGFSGPAIKKAHTLGIEVRTLGEANTEQVIGWLKTQHVVLDVSEWALADLAVELYDAPDGAELLPSIQQSFRERGPLAPIFVRNSDEKRFHVENIFIEWRKRNGPFIPRDLPPDGTRVEQRLHQPLDRNALHVETTKGNFDVRVIHITLWLSRSRTNVPLSKLAEYSDPSSPLVQIVEWGLQRGVTLSLHRHLESGETKVLMTVES